MTTSVYGHGISGTRRKADRLSILSLMAAVFFGTFCCCGCAATKAPSGPGPELAGRALVQQALAPSGIAIGLPGALSTALASSGCCLSEPLKHLEPWQNHGGTPFSLRLADGTVVQGLLFAHPDGKTAPKPLLMASFGFMQDRWGSEAAKFYSHYLENPAARLPAHVLILDHPTSGPFLANNGHLGMGSYDDGRMWIEVARHLRQRLSPSAIHLFGVSMSAQTVVHALIEDKRLGLNLFASGMAVSMATDFREEPARKLALLESSPGRQNPWGAYFNDLAPMTWGDEILKTILRIFIDYQFLPHYRWIEGSNPDLRLELQQVPAFLHDAFEDRITFLRGHPQADWNHEISLVNLDAFMDGTRMARFIGRVGTPLVLVSAKDDPAVPHPQFAEVLKACQGNPWVAAFETRYGGHFGFDLVYGPDYLGRVMELMMTPQVLERWNGSVQ